MLEVFINLLVFRVDYIIYFLSSSMGMLTDFRERGSKGEKEGEKHLCERETSIGCLSHTPEPGTETTT